MRLQERMSDHHTDQSGEEARIAPEVSRRVSAILDAVEAEAMRLREEAREEARLYLADAKARADELVAHRQQRIGQVSDELLQKADAVIGRLDDAQPVRTGFENLVRALGDAAERLTNEAEQSHEQYEPPPFHGEIGEAPAAAYTTYEAQPPVPPPPAPPVPAPAPPPPPVEAPAPPPPPVPAPPPPAAAPPPDAEQPHPARPPEPAGSTYEPAPEAEAEAHPEPEVESEHEDEVHEDEVPRPTHRHPSGHHSPDELPVDDARLIAIQMAAGGNTRGQVQEQLLAKFPGLESRPILDQVFGTGSAEDARVPWTTFPR